MGESPEHQQREQGYGLVRFTHQRARNSGDQEIVGQNYLPKTSYLIYFVHFLLVMLIRQKGDKDQDIPPGVCAHSAYASKQPQTHILSLFFFFLIITFGGLSHTKL